jgi:hypothetical protein
MTKNSGGPLGVSGSSFTGCLLRLTTLTPIRIPMGLVVIRPESILMGIRGVRRDAYAFQRPAVGNIYRGEGGTGFVYLSSHSGCLFRWGFQPSFSSGGVRAFLEYLAEADWPIAHDRLSGSAYRRHGIC